jgi:pyruvoyl-dependent arginine decarboxylase (PvlArgDC)
MIIPRDVSQWGYVMEFKKTGKNESVKAAAKSALKQMKERGYETELVEKGIKNYKKLAVVFKGKNVTIPSKKVGKSGFWGFGARRIFT